MERQYAATYQLDKVTVHVVAPPPISQEEIRKRVQGYCQAYLKYWNRLPEEECLRLNAKWKAEGR